MARINTGWKFRCLPVILISLIVVYSTTIEELCVDIRFVVVIGLVTLFWGWPFARPGQAVFVRCRRKQGQASIPLRVLKNT